MRVEFSTFWHPKTRKIGQLVKRGRELLIFFIVGLCIGPWGSKCCFMVWFWRSMFGNTVNYKGRIWLFDYRLVYKFVNVDITMCFWRLMFRNTVNYRGRVRDFDYRFVYKFANVDSTCVFEGHFSKTLSFFSQAPPKCRAEPSTSGRVFFHMEIRTLNARGMFRE